MKYTLGNISATLFEVLSREDKINKFYEIICEIINSFIKVGEIYIAYYDSKAKMIRFAYFKGNDQAKDRKPEKGLTEYLFFLVQAISVVVGPELFKELKTNGTVEQIGAVDFKYWAATKTDLSNGYKIMIAIQSNDAITKDHTDVMERIIGPIATAMRIWLREMELSKTNQKLATANQEIRELTSFASHDLKAPAGSLNAHAKFVKEYFDQLLLAARNLNPAEREQQLAEIERNLPVCFKIIDGSVGRIRSDHTQYHWSSHSTHTTLQS
jgi:signal transduction histidine kinase